MSAHLVAERGHLKSWQTGEAALVSTRYLALMFVGDS